MIAGPKQARLLVDFGEQYADNVENDQQHHEEGFSTRRHSAMDFVQVINEMVTHLLITSPSSLRWTHGMSLIILLSTQSAQWNGHDAVHGNDAARVNDGAHRNYATIGNDAAIGDYVAHGNDAANGNDAALGDDAAHGNDAAHVK